MIVGIDARILGGSKKSGIEEYTENLLSHMLPLDGSIKYKIFFSSYNRNIPNYSWLKLPNVELKRFKIPSKLFFASAYFLGRPNIDKLIGGADVFFSPHFLLAPLSAECKRVMTFHDLSYKLFPEFFSFQQNLWHKVAMKPWRQSLFADKIIAVSNSTKNDLVEAYKIDPAKIKVIYSGISSDMVRPTDFMLEEFRIKNHLPHKPILFLGKLEPRKNISGIIKAFNLLKMKGYDDCHLVIVGSKGWLFSDIFKEIKSSPFRDNIIYKKYINDDERKFYYSLADVFIYPSFFEGFGFPPLESIACGTPVVVSNNSSLPEIIQNDGLLINSNSINELATAIGGVLSDKNLKNRLIGEKHVISSVYNWSKTAKETLAYILE